MRLSTREEMQELDRRSGPEFNISEDQMMERAGTAMAERIRILPGLGTNHRICIFCGPGHNGGDGLVVARKLLEKGFQHVDVWTLPAEKPAVLFELNLRRFQDLKGNVKALDETQLTTFDFNKYEILIDAFFGTGLSRPLENNLALFIERINKQNVSCISLDVPTGLDANTGKVWGTAVRAIKTLTCGLSKPGFYLNEGPACTGKVIILDIGFPQELVKSVANSTFLIGKESAKRLLPPRKLTSNKSKFGRLLLVAGSSQMKGAAVLAGASAARIGVGYVTVASLDPKVSDFMPPDFLSLKWSDLLEADLHKYTGVIVGPGLGTGDEAAKILAKLKRDKVQNVLVDADALTVAAREKIWPLSKSWIMTPHAGELSRILGVTSDEIEGDRLKYAEEAHNKCGAVILLKGFRTVVCADSKKFIIGSGNVALAKAGTGDVLSGFVGSLMAQGLSADRAGALGAFLHGRIADRWIKKGGSLRTLMASDLPNLLHAVLAEME